MPSDKVLQGKKLIVDEMSLRISKAAAMVLVDHRGLTVEQDTEMRNELRNEGVTYSVVKNTLTIFAAKENGYDGLEKYLKGPTAIAFSDSDPIAAAKVLAKFEKKFDNLSIKAGVVDGKVINEDEVRELSKLPSKEELIARILSGLNAPISGFANVLNANMRGLVVALKAISEKKAG